MVKYRRRIDIVADILRVTEEGSKKTRIMYIANLSYKLLEKYLGETIVMGYVRSNESGYEVTEKGRAFLEKYKEFSSKYSRFEKKFESMQFEREILERMCEHDGSSRIRPLERRRQPI
jgi:predicted transcriptional regulator